MTKNLNISQKIYLLFKSIPERLIALILLILLEPVFIVIAILIKQDSPGPIFARSQIRIGKGRKVFQMYKFRTMTEGYEKIYPDEKFQENMYKVEEDPRVTNFGRKLRASDLDELPQLFNIIKGEMSFIGPRGFQPEEEKYYKKKYPKLRELINYRTNIKPGVTGLWQISGRNSTSLKRRLDLDKKYIDNVNPLLDIKILISTLQKVITKKWH